MDISHKEDKMDEKKRIEPVILRYEDGTVYTLEFNRETVAHAERSGFKRDQISNNEMTQIPLLFFLAFKMHHPTMTKEKADKIYFEDLGGMSTALSERLIELYNAPYTDLFNESGEAKNPNLTVVL